MHICYFSKGKKGLEGLQLLHINAPFQHEPAPPLEFRKILGEEDAHFNLSLLPTRVLEMVFYVEILYAIKYLKGN